MCKGVCKYHKVSGTRTKSPYELGYKFCPHCSIFVDYTGLRCECCAAKMRKRALRGKVRERMLENVVRIS